MTRLNLSFLQSLPFLRFAITALLSTMVCVALFRCGKTRTVAPASAARVHPDFNGDNIADKAVGASQSDYGGLNNGAVIVYYGSTGGLNTTNYTTIGYPDSDLSSNFGVTVATGDVNADGFDDLIVAASLSDYGALNTGTVYLFYGSASGIQATPAARIPNPVGDTGASYGNSISFAGDINGDGFGDIVIGAPLSDAGGVNWGAAFVCYGTASGFQSPCVTLTNPGGDASAQFGFSVSAAGDVNRDGYTDIAVAAYNSSVGGASMGDVFIYLGSASGIQTTPAQTITNPGGDAFSQFGRAIGYAGDVNGDGIGDLLVGAPVSDVNGVDKGAVFVYYGSGTDFRTTGYGTTAYPGSETSSLFGRPVVGNIDINGDGFSDFITGANSADIDGANMGAAFVFYGSASGILPTATKLSYSGGADASNQFGMGVAGGDLNGDGYADVVVTAYQSDIGASDKGAFFIFYGSPNGVTNSSTPISYPFTEPASASFGFSIQ
jgi:hypothetical protein